MAGLYIHIPFCKSRCIYCGFYSTIPAEAEKRFGIQADELRQRYVDALVSEMRQRRSDLKDERLTTVYLGGGTPSQLTPTQLGQLFTAIGQNFDCPWEEAEVTVECNPDDVTNNLAGSLGCLPVNRVSMGVQTLSDERLRFLCRRHTARQAAEAMSRLRRAGIGNISLDLMYGFPGESMEEWQRDVSGVLALEAEHLSAYALTYEEGTRLYQLWEKHPERYGPADEELQRQMYETLIDRLESAGYEHYEISNFARPGWRSRHNSGYWTHTHYIGLGAAAHSYDGVLRQWNISDVWKYIQGIEQEQPCVEREHIDEMTRYNEAVMLSLRTREGLDMEKLSHCERKHCEQMAQQFLDAKLLTLEESRLRLTREGLFVSDMIISQLMKV